MSIQDVQDRIKGLLRDERLLLSALLVCVAAVSFGVGRLSAIETSVRHALSAQVPPTLMYEQARSDLPTTYKDAEESNEPQATSSTEAGDTNKDQGDANPSLQGAYVASRKGTKYHLPWCPGARTISEDNKIWFATKEEAEDKGYSPAKNCKGI